jgi:hypothetical protein
LKIQVGAIEGALRNSPARQEEAPTRPFNGEAAFGAITRLKALLKASDGRAEEAFRSLQGVLAGVVEKPLLDALNASISDFDFEAALVKLDKIAELCARDGE